MFREQRRDEKGVRKRLNVLGFTIFLKESIIFKENICIYFSSGIIIIDDKYPTRMDIKRRERGRGRKIKLPSFNQTNNGRVSRSN